MSDINEDERMTEKDATMTEMEATMVLIARVDDKFVDNNNKNNIGINDNY